MHGALDSLPELPLFKQPAAGPNRRKCNWHRQFMAPAVCTRVGTNCRQSEQIRVICSQIRRPWLDSPAILTARCKSLPVNEKRPAVLSGQRTFKARPTGLEPATTGSTDTQEYSTFSAFSSGNVDILAPKHPFATPRTSLQLLPRKCGTLENCESKRR